jgi:hypothetical protein
MPVTHYSTSLAYCLQRHHTAVHEQQGAGDRAFACVSDHRVASTKTIRPKSDKDDTSRGFANAKTPGYEADDLLAAAVTEETRRKGRALVASGDRDAFQLASDTVTILHPLRTGEMARIGPEEVRERYGVEPAQAADFIALRGDPSDKIPGARGVGAKGAAALLRQYATLEDALTDGRFPLQAGELRLYRRIAAMDATAPASLVEQPDADLGQSGGAGEVLGAEPAGRAPGRNRKVDASMVRW